MQNVVPPFYQILFPLDIVPQIIALLIIHLETVEDQDLQNILAVLGKNLDSLSAKAITTHMQDHTVMTLECNAFEVGDE